MKLLAVACLAVRQKSALAAFALSAAALVAACGISLDSEPRLLEAAEIPPELLAPTTSTIGSSTEMSRTFLVYFVEEDGELVPRGRDLSLPATVDKLLKALFVGPSDSETELGLTSALPADTQILGTALSAPSVLELNLAEGTLEQIEGDFQRLAIAQIVFTVTELDIVDSLRVRIEGAPRTLPTDEGDLEVPVGRRHYMSLYPEDIGLARR